MTTGQAVDTARLALLLNDLRLPTIKHVWPQFAEQADKEGWPAARFLATIAEHDSPNAAGAGSSGTSRTLACRPARPSTPSTLTLCR